MSRYKKMDLGKYLGFPLTGRTPRHKEFIVIHDNYIFIIILLKKYNLDQYIIIFNFFLVV